MRLALFALAGLLLGSFLTVVVHRVPRRESVVSGRSRCPRCGTEIRARDNVPVISWVLLRGRCRMCGERISPEYPLTELGTAALFVAASVAIGPLFASIVVAIFLGLLLAIALIDARWRIVPNRIVYPALVLFAATLAVGDLVDGGVRFVPALIGALAYGLPMLVIALAVPGGMGMGDVKLAALEGVALGALGLRYVGVAAAAAILLGGLGGIAALLMGKGRRSAIPFGPYLAAGAVVAVFWGEAIASAYLGTFA